MTVVVAEVDQDQEGRQGPSKVSSPLAAVGVTTKAAATATVRMVQMSLTMLLIQMLMVLVLIVAAQSNAKGFDFIGSSNRNDDKIGCRCSSSRNR